VQGNRIALDALISVLAHVDLRRAHHADVAAILGEWPLDHYELDVRGHGRVAAHNCVVQLYGSYLVGTRRTSDDEIIEAPLNPHRLPRRPLMIRIGEHGNCHDVLFENDEFELLLEHWPAASATPVHDHGGARCFVIVLAGKLRVDDFVIVSRAEYGRAHVAFTGSRLLGRGAVDARASDLDLHRLSAVEGPAISLALLTKPRTARTVYDPNEDTYRIEPIDAARENAGVNALRATALPLA
jgi:hypothetical protein